MIIFSCSDNGLGCLDFDCTGECGGSAVVDECGECGGDGIDEVACDCAGNVLDCAGECGGESALDNCGVCDGGNTDQDCADVCFGDFWESDCGCVASDSSGNDCDDCAGIPNGDTVVDECGICDGNNTLCFGSAEGLDIITWNIENFPKNNDTIDSLSSIMNTLAVDIFALQEIESTQSLNLLNQELGENWEFYRSGSNSSYGELSYLINTDEIEIIQAPYTILQQYSYEFSYREPYVLEFTHNDLNYILINIHYKCCDGYEERRMQASIYLEDYISTNFSNERLILLGDFNDLLIDTYNVFDPFLIAPTNYEFGDYYIAEDPSALWSFPSWPSHIDHILVTNELFEVYDVQTIAIDQLFFNSLTDYDNLISDHRPLIIQISITP